MGLTTYLNRVNRIHSLIKRKCTGTPKEFAQKMNLSRSALLKDLSEMRSLGFPIEFDKNKNSYKYNLDKLENKDDFELSTEVLKQILGGIKRNDINKLVERLFYES